MKPPPHCAKKRWPNTPKGWPASRTLMALFDSSGKSPE
jgi:hypothetical protein